MGTGGAIDMTHNEDIKNMLFGMTVVLVGIVVLYGFYRLVLWTAIQLAR